MGTGDELAAALRSAETRDVAIELIATENRVPRFIAARVYDLLAARFGSGGDASNPTAR